MASLNHFTVPVMCHGPLLLSVYGERDTRTHEDRGRQPGSSISPAGVQRTAPCRGPFRSPEASPKHGFMSAVVRSRVALCWSPMRASFSGRILGAACHHPRRVQRPVGRRATWRAPQSSRLLESRRAARAGAGARGAGRRLQTSSTTRGASRPNDENCNRWRRARKRRPNGGGESRYGHCEAATWRRDAAELNRARNAAARDRGIRQTELRRAFLSPRSRRTRAAGRDGSQLG